MRRRSCRLFGLLLLVAAAPLSAGTTLFTVVNTPAGLSQ
jgi:hypothetical protein